MHSLHGHIGAKWHVLTYPFSHTTENLISIPQAVAPALSLLPARRQSLVLSLA